MTATNFTNRICTFRLAIAVLAILLGHNTLMAMDSQHTAPEPADHSHLAVEECLPNDGGMEHAGLPPTTPVMATTQGVGVDFLLDTEAGVSLASAAPAPDVGLVRLLHQVFLN